MEEKTKDIKKMSDSELERLWEQVGRNIPADRVRSLLDGARPKFPVESAFLNIQQLRKERKGSGVTIGKGGKLEGCPA